MKKISIILTLFTLASCAAPQSGVSQRERIKNNNFETMYYAKKECQKYASKNEITLTLETSPYQRCVLSTAFKNGYNVEVELN